MTTNELTKNTLEFLTMNGCFVWRSNNVPVMKHRSLNGIKGVTDIIGLTKTGVFIGVEIKNAETKDKQSAFQFDFQVKVKSRNAYYFVVTKIEDLQIIQIN